MTSTYFLMYSKFYRNITVSNLMKYKLKMADSQAAYSEGIVATSIGFIVTSLGKLTLRRAF